MRFGKKERRIVDSSADSHIRIWWVVILMCVAGAVVWAANFILFTPVSR